MKTVQERGCIVKAAHFVFGNLRERISWLMQVYNSFKFSVMGKVMNFLKIPRMSVSVMSTAEYPVPKQTSVCLGSIKCLTHTRC